MPYTYTENGVQETENNELISEHLTILCDNFFQYVFQQRRNEKIDYDKLKQHLENGADKTDAFYFFQKTNQNESAYDSVSKALEATGWKVITPVPQTIDDPKYGSMCETTAMQTVGVEQYMTNQGKCEHQTFILCINHLYYYPLVNFLAQKEDTDVKIICDKEELNDVFFTVADEIIDMLDMEISYVEQ